MKKIMIAAALAAIAGGAFAASPCSKAVDCGFGYRLRVIVRTTVGDNVYATDASSCDKPCGCYRKPAVRRILGFVYGQTSAGSVTNGPCGKVTGVCGCNGWETANVALWDYDTKAALNTVGAELLQLNRIGYENRTRAEMCFQLSTTCGQAGSTWAPLVFSGFGTCGKRDGVITLKTVSGFCAGLLPAVCGAASQCDKPTCGNTVWAMCSDTAIACGTTAAYGKWNLTWNQDIADYGKDKTSSLKGVEVKFGDLRACK